MATSAPRHPFRRAISRHGSRPISAGNGIRSMRATMSLGLAGCCWPGDGMRRMLRSQQRLVPIPSRAFGSGPTKFRKGRHDAAAFWSIEAGSPSSQPAKLLFGDKGKIGLKLPLAFLVAIYALAVV